MRTRILILWAVAAVAAAALFIAPTVHISHASPSGLVISAMYGGGSDVGSEYTHDYIEIFNAGTSAVALSGWSVQYRHATIGSSWQKVNLPAISLQAGQYFLIQQDSGLPRATSLPTPDAFGPADMRRQGQFVVALMSTTDSIIGDDPALDPNSMDDVEDLFGGGDVSTTVPTVFEGAYRSGTLDATTAWFRLDSGCQDTNNNFNDFASGPVFPNARNTATTLAPCTASGEADVTVGIGDSPDPVVVNNAVTYTVTASNIGTAGATNTVLTVDLSGTANPGAVTNISQGSCSFADPTLTCTIGALNTGSPFVVTFDVTPTVAGTIQADATIIADEPETDGNNADSETTLVNPLVLTGTTGSIDSDASVVSGENVTVTVTDADLAGDGTVSVAAEGSNGDSETLTLNETATPGTFSGTFAVQSAAPTDGNSVLEVPSGSITFTYVDALDAEGDVNTSLSDVTTVVPESAVELVVNGDFENGSNAWLLKFSAAVKCGAKGASSDCAMKLKPGASAKQSGQMESILSGNPTTAGDVLQLSAMAWSKRADSQPIALAKVNYATPTAGSKGNGKDKIKLIVSATTSYALYSTMFALDDAITGGSVTVKYRLDDKKLFVDNVSLLLMPDGTVIPPRAEESRAAPVPGGVLPPPAEPPDGFRG